MITRLVLFAVCLQCLWISPLARADAAASVHPNFPERSRVIVVQDPLSVEAFNPRPERLEPMINRGLMNLTGKESARDAWGTFISTQDIVGIKVLATPGTMSGTRPAVAAAIVRSLLSAGLSPKQIIVWDKHEVGLRLAGFFELHDRFGIQVAGATEEGYDEKASYETTLIGKLVWGDHEFGKKGEGVGRKSFVSKLVTQKITKIINVTPLLNHNLTGVSGNLFGLAFGSVDNTLRFEFSTERLATAIPEIYALPELGERVVLNIVDALICQYQGEERTYFHYATPLGQLRFSKDPVALDVLSIQELNRQRQAAKIPGSSTNLMIYTNASLLELGISDLSKIDVITVP